MNYIYSGIFSLSFKNLLNIISVILNYGKFMWFIIRHGETLHNLIGIKQGRYSSILDLKGVDQIKSIAYRLQNTNENFDNYKLVVSPMIRTKHSMQIIQEILGLIDEKQIEEPLLNEMDCGECTNMDKKIIEQNYADVLRKRKGDYWNARFPGGESYSEVYERIAKFCDNYKNEQNMIIITHGVCVKFLKSILKKVPKNDIINDDANQNYFYCWDGKELKRL